MSIILWILSIIAAAGISYFLFLRKPKKESDVLPGGKSLNYSTSTIVKMENKRHTKTGFNINVDEPKRPAPPKIRTVSQGAKLTKVSSKVDETLHYDEYVSPMPLMTAAVAVATIDSIEPVQAAEVQTVGDTSTVSYDYTESFSGGGSFGGAGATGSWEDSSSSSSSYSSSSDSGSSYSSSYDSGSSSYDSSSSSYDSGSSSSYDSNSY